MKRIKKEILEEMYVHRVNELNEILDFIANSPKSDTDISIKTYKFVARDLVRDINEIEMEIQKYN